MVASDAQTVVETTAGKIRGYSNDGIYTFKGVPYAEPPTGALRFMPPTKVKPWTGHSQLACLRAHLSDRYRRPNRRRQWRPYG